MADAYNKRSLFKLDNQIEYNFSGVNGQICFIIGGHIHRDYVGFTKGGIPLVTLDCDGRCTYSVFGNEEGTINEQCITTVLLDKKGVAYFIRFGRGNDFEVAYN